MTGFGGNQVPDPFSKNSKERGREFIHLPNKQCTIRVPNFPLPELKDKALSKREQTIWSLVWRTPQAFQWHKEHWRWQEIAEYCRTLARFEKSGSSGMGMLVEKQRTSIGLNAMGLRANGWMIDGRENELRDKRSRPKTASKDDFASMKKEISFAD